MRQSRNDLESMIDCDLDDGKDYQLQHSIMDVVASIYAHGLDKMTAQDRKSYLDVEEVEPVAYIPPSPTQVNDLIQQLITKHNGTI